MRRREFLSTVGIGAGALLADGLRSRRSAHAAEWGTYPAAHRAFEVPASRRPQAVLETFLFGGLSPWETFYVVDEPEYGRATQEMWWTFQEGEDNVSEVWSRCRPAGDRPLLVDFARDERGAMVKLGPFIDPIRRRPDLLERMRVHVLSHDLAPHMLAIPYALTGHHFGDPRLAGVGTVVQRYFQSRGEDRGRPVSYLIRPLERNPLFGAASDVGLHPSSARPLTLHVGADRQFVDALQRRSLGSQADAADALTRHYLQQFKRRLTPASLGRAVRSRAFDEFEHSAQLVQGARGLVDAFPAEALALAPGEACGEREPEAESLTQPGSRRVSSSTPAPGT
ncbi:MAG: hypothetical protein U0325_07225 [Polyangiales bacterium]